MVYAAMSAINQNHYFPIIMWKKPSKTWNLYNISDIITTQTSFIILVWFILGKNNQTQIQ